MTEIGEMKNVLRLEYLSILEIMKLIVSSHKLKVVIWK
jgi:hypothetical protein